MSEPIRPEVRASMNGIAKAIESALPPGYVFGLFVADVGGGGAMNWISNGQREDMVAALKEWIAHAEGRAVQVDVKGDPS